MASVNVTLVGSAYLKDSNDPVNVTIIADMYKTGLEVGGGPIIPEPKPPTDAHPEHPIVLPPTDAHPEHPIVLPDPPDLPPPSVWPPGPGIDFPEHPIVIPPPVDELPIEPGSLIEWHAVWTPDRGWFIVGLPQVPHPVPSA